VEGIIEAVLESSDERKVLASLSLFLKSGKFPAVLYIGKGPEYRPFCDLRSVPEALLLYINFDSFHHLNQVVVTRGVCINNRILLENYLFLPFAIFPVASAAALGSSHSTSYHSRLCSLSTNEERKVAKLFLRVTQL